tara:strand:- start:219 stop:398 length:180 start_codon:yes stop_codon:yes gene_type:complete
MKNTYNITIKCNTEEERDIVLETVDTLVSCGIVKYQQESNVYFSENEQLYISERERVVA